jgi:hypothetical protein
MKKCYSMIFRNKNLLSNINLNLEILYLYIF